MPRDRFRSAIPIPALLVAVSLAIGACGRAAPTDSDVVIANPHDGLWQTESQSQSPFRFVLEQVYGASEEAGTEGEPGTILSQVLAGTVDDDGNLYVVDAGADAIVAFAPDGSLRWRADQRGEGPGELSRVSGLMFDGRGLLYVVNQSNRRIDRFDLNGVLVDSHAGDHLKAGGRTPILGFLTPDTLVISTLIRDRHGALISVVSVAGEWNVARTIELTDSIDFALLEGMNGIMPVAMDGDRIVTGSTGEYRFRTFDQYGKIERIATRSATPMVAPFSERTERGFAQYFPSDATWLGRVGDIHVTTTRRPSREMTQDEYRQTSRADDRRGLETIFSIDYFDRDWRLLYSIESLDSQELNPPLGLVAVGPDERLYVRMSNGVQVGRYRMEVDEP